MHAFEYGLIQLNDKPVSSDTKIGQHDVICHRVHRHEPPVFAKAPLTIVHQDENLVVIDKPSSIPVHPTGKFWFNSVESIMKFEMSLGSLFPVHRLDRLTSGVLVFAKNKQVAQTWSAMIREHQGVHKEYIARVEGKFPSEPVEVDQPIKVFEFKNDICRVDPSGKPSVTVFELLATNGVESVVRCSFFHIFPDCVSELDTDAKFRH
jgi:RluA family pseudouridine synthase